MIVALDANCLVAWSSQHESDSKARLDELLRVVSAAGGKVVIPMPCFAEYLVGLDEASAAWVSTLERKKSVILAPFDRRAAFECALMDGRAIRQGDKRGGRKEPWQRIKIDRQAVAIAKVHQTERMISNDSGVRATALSVGIAAAAIEDLALPDSAKQVKLNLVQASETKRPSA